MTTIFPIKAYSYALALRGVGVCFEGPPVEAPADGWDRMVVSAPEVLRALARDIPERSRLRLAVPPHDVKNGFGANDLPTLEVYSEEGKRLFKPWPITELRAEVANALQVDILARLLAAKGVVIPMV